MVATPVAQASCGPANSTACPSSRISPASGRCAPDITLISVDLAGAVVAHQRHDFAAAEFEVDAFERQHAAKPLGDAGHRKLGHIAYHALNAFLSALKAD